ncbi:sensor histidine kinase [Dyella tabacisoli]|nr:histidine kinase [Dyella tabacisoli]
MIDAFKSSPKRLWLLQIIGWLGFGLISALAALQFKNARPLLIYFAGMTWAGYWATFPLLAFCRWLSKSGMSWTKIILLTVGSCYVLGAVCSLTGAILEAWLGHPAQAGTWRSVLFVGVTNAIAPMIMLIAWAGIYFGLRQWEEAGKQERRTLRSEALARDAELRALRYQITPHFLFNTLNGISTLVGEGEIQPARNMISLLAEFLRSTLEPTDRGDVTIAEELRQVRQYIAIEQIRLGDRMHVSIDADPDLMDVAVPHLLLQPLVENAIRHGIAPLVNGGKLSLVISAEGPFARMRIHNTYVPRQEIHRRAISAPAGVGLANTRERLMTRYGTAHYFSASGDPSDGWSVVLDVPRDTTEKLHS